MGNRVDISVHVESCCTALAPRSSALPVVSGGGGALVFVGNVIVLAGYVVARTAALAARLTLVAGGAVLLLGAGACHVVGLLGPVLRVGGEEAIALARIGGE